MNKRRGSQFYHRSKIKLTANPLSLTDYRPLTGDGNGPNIPSRKEVGEITDFTNKVGTVVEKPPTFPDSPDTHP
jgi:hypothetical protein